MSLHITAIILLKLSYYDKNISLIQTFNSTNDEGPFLSITTGQIIHFIPLIYISKHRFTWQNTGRSYLFCHFNIISGKCQLLISLFSSATICYSTNPLWCRVILTSYCSQLIFIQYI